MKAIIANWIAPGLLDTYLARAGYTGQLTSEALPPGTPGNLFEAVPGNYGAHGRFGSKSTTRSWEVFTDRHRAALWVAAAASLAASLHMAARRLRA